MNMNVRMLSTVAALGMAQVAAAGSINVFLDEDAQGKGNKGTTFRPVDEFGDLATFELTARSMIDENAEFDPNAIGSIGTIYIDKDDTGAGVQTGEPKGSKGISGGGGHRDEELLFTFDAPILASAFQLGINEFDAGNGIGDKDDAILFIDVVGEATPVILDELAYLSALTWTGSESGLIDFGALGLGTNAMITAVGIRETNDHIYVNLVAVGPGSVIPLPAPFAIGVAGLALLGISRRRKQTA